MSEKLQKWRTLNIHSAPLYPLWQVIPSKLPRSGLRRCESVLVVASVYVSVNFFFFFLREVLVDNLLPAAVAASCSSQQWEKEPGRRVGRRSAGGAGRAAAGGGKKAHTRSRRTGSERITISQRNNKSLCQLSQKAKHTTSSCRFSWDWAILSSKKWRKKKRLFAPKIDILVRFKEFVITYSHVWTSKMCFHAYIYMQKRRRVSKTRLFNDFPRNFKEWIFALTSTQSSKHFHILNLAAWSSQWYASISL